MAGVTVQARDIVNLPEVPTVCARLLYRGVITKCTCKMTTAVFVLKRCKRRLPIDAWRFSMSVKQFYKLNLLLIPKINDYLVF